MKDDLNDLFEHLRNIHFILVAACVIVAGGMVTKVFLRGLKNAADDAATIAAASSPSGWNQFWTSYAKSQGGGPKPNVLRWTDADGHTTDWQVELPAPVIADKSGHVIVSGVTPEDEERPKTLNEFLAFWRRNTQWKGLSVRSTSVAGSGWSLESVPRSEAKVLPLVDRGKFYEGELPAAGSDQMLTVRIAKEMRPATNPIDLWMNDPSIHWNDPDPKVSLAALLLNTSKLDRDTPLDTMSAAIESRARDSAQSIEAFGFKVPIEGLTILGSAGLIVLQLYLFMHLLAFNRKRSEHLDGVYPWIGIYGDTLSRMVFRFTAILLPVIVTVIGVVVTIDAEEALWQVPLQLVLIFLSLTLSRKSGELVTDIWDDNDAAEALLAVS